MDRGLPVAGLYSQSDVQQELLEEGWQIHYRLSAQQMKFTGVAAIHRDGAAQCELSIFEPQSNALASIDLLREQCVAWISARPTSGTTIGTPAI